MSSQSLSNLKDDIKLLESIFSKKTQTSKLSTNDSKDPNLNANPCFRLITGSTDELVCELIDANKKKYRINANICVNSIYFCL